MDNVVLLLFFRDEIGAALFIYSEKFNFNNSADVASSRNSIFGGEDALQVEQVDFVPTFSLLLGVPIPYSNLGRIMDQLPWSGGGGGGDDIFSTSSSVQRRQNGTKSRLKYMNSNVKQVMKYLDSYRLQGGNLPFSTYTSLTARHEAFKSAQSRPLSLEDMESIYKDGSDLVKDAKTMCRAVWVEFDLQLMGAGLTLFLLQTVLGFVLLATPKNRLLTGEKFESILYPVI